jgi:SAM-dependent methyltransferase
MNKSIRSLAKGIRTISRKMRGKERSYTYKRIALSPEPENGMDCSTQQILNLLNYTKTSGSSYNGQDYPAGYHTLDIKNFHLAGQRHPKERFDIVPFDFTGKTVLDIGCNQGGMLFNIADKISCGVGIDYDRRVINASNKIRSYTGTHSLDFYVFDLEREDLNLIKDFIPREKVDIVFLLAVCMWIKNWKSVIDLAREISGTLLFESNGEEEQQDEQVAYLRRRYKNVQLLSGQSLDDLSQQSRRLYLCN